MEFRLGVRTELMIMPILRRKTPLGRPEMKWQPVTESKSTKVVDDQSGKIIATDGNAVRVGEDAGDADEKRVRNWRSPEKGRLQESGIEDVRQNGKSFRNAQHARQQIPSEIVQGFKNEEKCKKLVQNELAVMKDELKNLKMGRGSTVLSEANTGVGWESGTFAWLPPLTSRWNDIFVPRKMEFKGWVTDFSESSFQGITDDEVATLVSDLERMVPQQANRWIDLGPEQEGQGTWPTKPMVSMLFKSETNLVTMIDLLRGMKEGLENSLQDSWTKCKSEVGNQSSEETLGKGASFVLQGAQGDERR